MESNWRYDIARAGLVGYGLRLYARLVEYPDYWMGGVEDMQINGWRLFYWPDPEQLPVDLGGFGETSKSFPFGIPVYPDNVS